MKNNTVLSKKSEVLHCENKSINIDYSLIITDSKECDLFEDSTIYSILIVQLEGGIATQYDFLYDIARDEENAVAILDTLVYNNVMPSNARDVLADIL